MFIFNLQTILRVVIYIYNVPTNYIVIRDIEFGIIDSFLTLNKNSNTASSNKYCFTITRCRYLYDKKFFFEIRDKL